MRPIRLPTPSLALALLWLACGPGAAPPPLPEPAAEPIAAPEDFSADAAWGHLEALAAAGPRGAGAPGVAAARAHLGEVLRGQGLEVVEQRAQIERGGERIETVNLVARIPGASDDVLLLVAPYDSPPGDASADSGASGAALVVELARALGARRPAYTIWVALVEGDALAQAGAVPRADVGTGALAHALSTEGTLARVRLAVYFDRVAGADLRIARDLMSQRSAREDFWLSARRLGHGAVFPPDAAFESVEDGHLALVDAGLRQTLAISASRRDAGAVATGATGDAAATGAAPDDLAHASRESLGTVGTVSLEALSKISGRLAKIDRFVKSPLDATATAPAPPAPEAAPPSADPPPSGEPAPPAGVLAPPTSEPGPPPEAAATPPVEPVQADGAR